MRIAKKLHLGFGAVITLLFILATVAYVNFLRMKDANKWTIHTYQVIAETNGILESLINIETGQRGFSLSGIDASLEPVSWGVEAFKKHIENATTLTSDNPTQQERYGKLQQSYEQWMSDATEPAIALRRAVIDGSESIDAVVEFERQAKGKTSMDAMRVLISEINGMELELLEKREAEVNSLAATTLTTLIVLSVIAVLVAVSVAVVITRSITQPIAKAVDVAKAIANGNLDAHIEAKGTNETAQLLTAMKMMVSTLQNFSAAQEEMARQHEVGATDYFLQEADFPGIFGKLAQGNNGLVASHIAVKNHVVDITRRYAAGDLSATIDRLPGQEAKISEAIDGVQASLKSINGDIKNLVAAASSGNFSARGDVDKYQNDFRDMVVGLNQLMETSDTGLGEVSRVLMALAKCDLTDTIKGDYQGTFLRLKEDTNATVQQLRDVMAQISGASESIKTGSTEIAAGNQDLSSRTEQQAANVEEASASMDLLNSTVKSNAESADRAKNLAEISNAGAARSGEIVKRVVSTMGEIQSSSKKIADIISVIDGIAFQTNILALNAAVEAARAGDQGRGFAVVASEVRTLAQRSAMAAKEIKDLIAKSVEDVNSGVQQVELAGTAMNEVVASFKDVSDLVTEISGASREQSDGIGQVAIAIAQIGNTTQQNAALVEESAAAAESLQEQAVGLVDLVTRFKRPESQTH